MITTATAVIAALCITYIPLLYVLFYDSKVIKRLKSELELLLSQKKSSEVRLGQISEQLAPFIKGFNYDPKRAHFLGNPIDYVIFEDDKVVFLEVKSGKARLTKGQRDIKENIEAGKVVFETMRIDGQEE